MDSTFGWAGDPRATRSPAESLFRNPKLAILLIYNRTLIPPGLLFSPILPLPSSPRMLRNLEYITRIYDNVSISYLTIPRSLHQTYRREGDCSDGWDDDQKMKRCHSIQSPKKRIWEITRIIIMACSDQKVEESSNFKAIKHIPFSVMVKKAHLIFPAFADDEFHYILSIQQSRDILLS